MRPFLICSGAKDGKTREITGNNFTFHDQIPVQNAVKSKNPKFESGFSSCYEGIFAKVV